jgi:hypothetical protein
MSVKQEFIFETMQELDHKFFAVLTPNYDTVYMNFNAGISLENSIKKLKKFFDSCDAGMYVVKIFQSNEMKNNNTPKQDGLTFDITLQPTLKEPTPVNGTQPVNMGVDHGMLDKYLGSKDSIAELQVQMLKNQMEFDKQKAIDEIRREYEERIRKLEGKEGIQGVIMSLLPELAPHLAGFANKALSQVPINGVIEGPSPDQTAKQKIVSAINVLTKVDPNFAENISKLSEVAQAKPQVYNMAIDMLKKM